MLQQARLYFLGLAVLLSCHVAARAWINGHGKDFTFQCRDGESITRMLSEHTNGVEDRQFNFECSGLPVQATLDACEWSDFTYSPREVLHYQCPHSGIITGVHSSFDKDAEDRQFSFQCCTPSGYVPHACEIMAWTNRYDRKQDAQLPKRYVLRGVTSVYDKGHYDRIYSLFYCKLGELAKLS